MSNSVIVVLAPPPVTRYSLFLPSEVPTGAGPLAGSLNAGIAFFVSVACNLIAIRFYKRSDDPDTSHTVNLWDVASHAKLAEAVSSSEPASGWVEVPLSTPVPLTANKAYYVTFFMPSGYYSYTDGYFGAAVTRGPITGYQDGTVPGGLVANTGIYHFGSVPTYPDSGYPANYWADVVVD